MLPIALVNFTSHKTPFFVILIRNIIFSDRIGSINMRINKNRKIEISIAGLVLVAASLSILAVATDRLVKSITTYERMSGTGDYSIDENEFSLL